MANLDEWNRRFHSPEIFNPIHSYYFFSPEWEDVVRPLQESYEKLEAERQAIGEPRREWQANVESLKGETCPT
ncbi:hypothetical protein COL940_007117 [Colletotrichum noveboracense]|nr:hypothetical protein COL940_007117 [Colletotrichum noveboracense]